MRNYHLTSLKALFDPIVELVIMIYFQYRGIQFPLGISLHHVGQLPT